MIENVLKEIGGIEHFGMISLALFFVCFLGMLIWALFLRKPFLEKMSRLPLNVDPEDSDKGTHNHE